MLLWPRCSEPHENTILHVGGHGRFVYDALYATPMGLRDDVNIATPEKSTERTLRTFAGEIIDTIGGPSCIYKYMAPCELSSSRKTSEAVLPLIVLIPGGAHNARVFYGGHVGFDEEDFLAFWLNKLGFPVLAISYPLEYHENVSPIAPDAPGFRITHWGEQAAMATKRVVDQHPDLATREILLAGWSMGGRILGPFVERAIQRGLRVGLFVSLAATPGFGGMRPVPTGIRCTANGYANCDGLLDNFLHQINQQETRTNTTNHESSPRHPAAIGSRHIIPPEIFTTLYFGYTPISLHGWQLAHNYNPDTSTHTFIPDKWGSEEDSSPTDFHSLPWICSITGTSSSDARHALLDESAWDYISAQRLTAIWERWQTTQNNQSKHPDPFSRIRDMTIWQEFSKFTRGVSRDGELHRKVVGNHYFFLGKDGARETAAAIWELWDRKGQLEDKLTGIFAGVT